MFDIFNRKKLRKLEKDYSELHKDLLYFKEELIKNKFAEKEQEAQCSGVCSSCVHGIIIQKDVLERINDNFNFEIKQPSLDGIVVTHYAEANGVICELKAKQLCEHFQTKQENES